MNQRNARPGGYDAVIAEIAEKKICPFCSENLAKIHQRPLDIRQRWIVTDNMYPYQPSLCHKLIIHREHIEHIEQMATDAWQELGEIIQEFTREQKIVGGTFLLRFGETKFTGASVAHLHANLVQSNPDDALYDPAIGLRTRIG